MKIKNVTEIGIAVKDLDKASYVFREILGAELLEVVHVEMFQMKYRMARIGKMDFELMAPTGDKGTIADFIRKRGEGLHHIAFAVENIENGVKKLKEKKINFISEIPLELHGNLVDFKGNIFNGAGQFIFTHPSSFFGTLFEFIEYPDEMDMSV